MTEHGEQPAIRLADVIIASQTATANPDDFLEAVAAHALSMPTEEDLLADSRNGLDLSFLIRPNLTGRRLFAREVERGPDVEKIERERNVTIINPFLAQRCSLRLEDTRAPHEGSLEFHRDFERRSAGPEVIRNWLVRIAVSDLADVDIRERRNGRIITDWVDGALEPIDIAAPSSAPA
jgi:hypothetical protein